MRRRRLPAGFEHIGETDQVGLHVDGRRFQRIAHPGLRRQVQHPARSMFGEYPAQGGGIFYVDRFHGQIRAQCGHPVVLQLRIVVIVEIVQSEQAFAAREQSTADVGADKAGSAGDQNGGIVCGHRKALTARRNRMAR